MLLCGDTGEALFRAFKIRIGLNRCPEVVERLGGLAKRLVGLTAPAQGNCVGRLIAKSLG